jgi:cobalt/nickel transport system permease protein
MHDIHSITSDAFAQKQNWVTAIDARVKMVFVLLALLINLFAPTVYTPLAFAVLSLSIVVVLGVQPKLLLVSFLPALTLAVTVVIVQMFFYGHTPLYSVPVWHFQVTAYREGLTRGLLIMSRVVGGVSLILFLSMSTPVNRLLTAARWFRISPTFIELALLVYRYIFVLLEEVISIRSAQRVRLGYSSWGQSMKSLGTLGGSVIIRAYDRAERAFDAMLVRGYTGEVRAANYQNLRRTDYLAIATFAAILVGLALMGVLLK